MDDTTAIGHVGEPGSIIPAAGEDQQPLSERLGRDPSNLGDEVADQGDVVYPDPEPPENDL